MWPVPGDLPRGRHHTQAPDRFRRRPGACQILKQEEPFCCIRCSKPFGVKSTIDRVVAKLEDKHWMYTGSRRIDVIKMCEDCRVGAAAEESFDPYGAQGPDYPHHGRLPARTRGAEAGRSKQGLIGGNR